MPLEPTRTYTGVVPEGAVAVDIKFLAMIDTGICGIPERIGTTERHWCSSWRPRGRYPTGENVPEMPELGPRDGHVVSEMRVGDRHALALRIARAASRGRRVIRSRIAV